MYKTNKPTNERTKRTNEPNEPNERRLKRISLLQIDKYLYNQTARGRDGIIIADPS